jgi:hypothetical protein
VDCKPRILGLDANKIQRSSTSLYIRSFSVQNKMDMLTSLKRSAGYGKCSLDELYCAICLEVFCRPVVTECWHIFCVDCIKSSLHRKVTFVINSIHYIVSITFYRILVLYVERRFNYSHCKL